MGTRSDRERPPGVAGAWGRVECERDRTAGGKPTRSRGGRRRGEMDRSGEQGAVEERVEMRLNLQALELCWPKGGSHRH